MADKISGILQSLLQVIAGASQIAIDRKADSGVIDFKEPIDKAETQIKSLLHRKMPKGMKDWCPPTRGEMSYTLGVENGRKFGYNDCLSDVHNVIDEI